MDFCLLCLEMSYSPGVKVESSQWKEESIAELIDKHFWPMKTMSNTAWICMGCWQTISEFHKFYIRIENAHACFTSVLKTESPDDIESEEIYIRNERRIETRTSNNNQLDLEIPVVIHVEPELLVETVLCKEEIESSIKKESETEEQVDQNVETKQPVESRCKDPLQESAKPRKCKKNANKKISKAISDKVSQNDHSDDNEDKDTTSEDELSDNKSNSDSDIPTDLDFDGNTPLNYQPSTKYKDQDEFLAKNFKLICGICQTHINTFHELLNHSGREHKQRGFVWCCNKKFFRRTLLVEHIHWHLDPEYFKCKNCGKVMANRRCLINHSKLHEKQDRNHICSECGKAFGTALALKRHKFTHLPDEEKKYSCNQCGKNFGDNNSLSNHERSVHLNKYALVCDLCGRHMRSKEVFERHMLKHEGLSMPTVSCDVCGLKMTTRSLKRHKEIQHPEGGFVEYKCHICSKISPTLKAHKKHVQYQHELGNAFKCTICEKAFKRAISLTEHMATHTGTVLYTCPYCPKTFNSNANMHHHRKKNHPKEWEEACRAKYSGNLPPNYKLSNV